MAYTSINICSKALSKLGVEGITSFEDGTAESEIASSLYDLIKDGLLSSYPWSFATAQKRLSRLADAPIADYKYSYHLPNDYLRIISAGSGKKSLGLSYRISGNKLCTNSSEVIITYIYKVYEEDLPPFFCDALTTKLASEFCLSLIDDTAKANYLVKKAEDEIKTARLIDAQQSTPKKFEDFTLVEVRK
ncbi:MAG: hypothetical protein LBR70_05155 [Lactobacillaceae bacterium]|jgi:hypothetical protein|nr:hypothetical protein [Lactobacillaceae bacterium]